MQGSQKPIEIFCSYAHADERWLQLLDTHLSLMYRQGLISTWYDRQITAGTDWAQAIDTHLNSASVILLLISADFLASDYCYGIEMERALERHQSNEARVIPILLRSVDWKGASFAHLQALPTNAKPVTSWNDQDEAFADVATGIRQAIENLTCSIDSTPHVMPLPVVTTDDYNQIHNCFGHVLTHSTLPEHVHNIPYPPNPYFTGREEVLSQLEMTLQAGQPAALSQPQAISGLGGIGKTQIVLAYAYRHLHEYQAILWSRADTTEALISGFATFAKMLQLVEKDAEDQLIAVQAAKDWLKTHDRWLLILDNADELALVRDFLPPASQGHTLLTTRAASTRGLANRIEVESLDTRMGALLVLRRADLLPVEASLDQAPSAQRVLAQELVEAMGGLPLALDQAGAYMENVSSSLSDYLRLYRQSQGHLLKVRGSLTPDHPEPVATTWSLSFERTEQHNTAAADLLRVCAFLQADAIPEEILREGAQHLGQKIQAISTSPLAFDEAIETLRSYSLIMRNPTEHLLSVHRLVQAVIKDAMNKETYRLWAERAIHAVEKVLPEVDHATRGRYERCLSHALGCADLIEQLDLTSSSATRLLFQTAFYLSEHARYGEAEPLYEQALQIYHQVLGAEHPDVAISLNNLAALHRDQGKYELAEPLYEQALQIRRQVLGVEHPDVAISLNNLAGLYKDQGKYELAEPLYEQALQIYRQILGAEHPNVAQSLNNLALLYYYQGKYELAEPLYEQALQIYRQVLGAEHPAVASSLNNLAGLYHDQGKYELAEPLYEQALQIRRQILGAEHPAVATSLNNLAELYRDQGKYELAEPLYEQALQIRRQILGAEHPAVATSLNNLAELYHDQGKYELAEPLYEQALQIYRQILGAEHPTMATSLNNLAALYRDQGKYKLAEPLYEQALQIYRQILGAEHPDLASSLNNLAGLYRDQGKHKLAEPLYEQALQIRHQALGAKHPAVAISLNNLAGLYRDQGKYELAEPLYEQALQIYRQILGTEHSAVVTSLNNLAGLYRDQGKYELAEPLYEQALQIRRQILETEHPNVATSLNNLAELYHDQGKYELAESLYEQALQIYCQILGVEHPLTQKIGKNCTALHLLIEHEKPKPTIWKQLIRFFRRAENL